MFYYIINWYTKRFPFPFRGLKYMVRLLRRAGLEQRLFQKKLHNGLRLRVSPQDHVQRQLFWYGYYEKKYMLTWECFVCTDAIVLDIGAHIGYYSVVAAKRATTGFVYSFEPYSLSFSLLQQNIALNKLCNISAVQAAVCHENGETALFISESDNTGMTGLTEAENFSGSTETVQMTTLDAWMKKARLERVTLIKMDMEGSEYNALKGAVALLQKYKPVLFIEISNRLLGSYGFTSRDIYLMLADYGYTAYCIKKQQVLKRIETPLEDELVVFLPNGFVVPEGIIVVT